MFSPLAFFFKKKKFLHVQNISKSSFLYNVAVFVTKIERAPTVMQ